MGINLSKHQQFQIKILRQNFPTGLFVSTQQLIQEMIDVLETFSGLKFGY